MSNARNLGNITAGGATGATTASVTTSIDNLIDASPGALNTLNELAAALGDDANFSTTVTNSIATKLPLAGGTMTGNLTLGDNVKIEIGSNSGGDLQIYHDGNSKIADVGGGKLELHSDGTGVFIQKGATEYMAKFETDGAVTLYHDNSPKLATTATGVDITGITTSNGFSGKIHPVNGTTTNYLSLKDTNELNFYNSSGASQTLHINYDGGNVDLAGSAVTVRYSDKLVGIGETNPANILHIKTSAGGGPQIELDSTSGTANSAFINFDGTSLQLSTQRDMVDGSKRDTAKSWGGINIVGVAAGSYINFQTSEGNNNAVGTRMTITKEGDVGIGATNPGGSRLYLQDTHTTTVTNAATMIANTTLTINGNSSSGSDVIRMGPMDIAGRYFIDVSNSAGNAAYDLLLNPIGGGNVGIGTTNPSYKLHVNSGATNVVADFESTDGTAAIRLRDNAGNVELATVGGDFRVQPGGGTATMEVSSGGASWQPTNDGSYQFTAHGNAHLTIRTGTYTGANYGTNIAQSNVQIVNSAFGALVFVRGYNPSGYPSGQFCDLVYFGYNASPTIIAQQTVAGSPPNRIYTGSGYALYLRYSSNVMTTAVSYIQSS
jgi:hypothetical protein